MKKLFLIIILFGLQGYSQKILEIVNTLNINIQISDIITNASGSYPEFHSKPFGYIPLGPFGSYVLQNNNDLNRFPFNSPTSVPYIDRWERLNSPTSSLNMTSLQAWGLSISMSQVFARMSFSVGGVGYTIDTSNTATSPLYGNGFIAEYVPYPTINPTTYTIVFY